MMNEAGRKLFTSEQKQKKTEFSPFKFKTEERKGHKSSYPDDASSDKDGNLAFKARSMPKYKFFEVKHEPHKKTLFKEFQLAVDQRQNSKQRSSSLD